MKFFCALLISAAFHAILCIILVFYLNFGVNPDGLAKLDVSSVELSLTESEAENAAPNISMPPVKEDNRPLVENFDRPDFKKEDTQIVDEIPVIAPLVMPGAEVVVTPKMETPDLLTQSRQNDAILAPQQARVEAKPNPKRPIKLKYPNLSRERGEQGSIRLKLGINAKGLVENIEILSSTGFKLLDDAALKAVKAASFIPAHIEGEAIFSTSEIKLEFKLK